MRGTLAAITVFLLLVILVPLGQASPPQQDPIPENTRLSQALPMDGKEKAPAPTRTRPMAPVERAESHTSRPVRARQLEPADLERWDILALDGISTRDPEQPHGPPNTIGQQAPVGVAGVNAVGRTGNVLIENSSGTAGNPSVTTDSSGTMYVAYQCYDSSEAGWDLCMAKSYDNGRQWHSFIVWDDDLGHVGSHYQPDLVIDGSGTLWMSFRSTDANGYCSWLTSNDGGASWTMHYISSWTWYAQAHYPRIALSGSYVYITFQYDYITDYDIQYVYSTDGGSNWNGRYALANSAHCRVPIPRGRHSTMISRPMRTKPSSSPCGTTRPILSY